MYALSSFLNGIMKNIEFVERFIYEHCVFQYSFISNRDTQLGIRINHKDKIISKTNIALVVTLRKARQSINFINFIETILFTKIPSLF